MTIEELGLLAGALMSIIGLIASFAKPAKELNKTIIELNLTLSLLSKDLEASKEDRKAIHEELKRQGAQIDSHEIKIVEHGQQIKTLFNGGK